MYRTIVIGLICMLLSLGGEAQVIDTVCPGEKNINYHVFQNPGASYQWTIDGGVISSGNGTADIVVDWGTQLGLHQIQVVETNAIGCMGDPSIAWILIKGSAPVLGYPLKLCKGDTAQLKLSNATSALWADADTAMQKQIKMQSDTGGWVIASNANCGNRQDTLRYQIKLGAMPLAVFTPDTGTYRKNEQLVIQYQGNSNDQLNWQIKKLNIFNKSDHSFLIFLVDTGSTEIKLIAMSKDGCIDSNYKWIYVEDEHLYAPNAFTPNGDGLNDQYKPAFVGMQRLEIKILSRWGELVYQNTDLDSAWDGNYKGAPAQPDTYTYMIYARGVSGKEYFLKGPLELIR